LANNISAKVQLLASYNILIKTASSSQIQQYCAGSTKLRVPKVAWLKTELCKLNSKNRLLSADFQLFYFIALHREMIFEQWKNSCRLL
jgi:hypothetical protein